MSYIGIVTRKEMDTGVNLMAKVVTPSKKKSVKKSFRVKVKANALDDFSCCVIDHATTKNKIENSQDLSGVLTDLDFVYNGIHGTQISYQLVDTTVPGISSYITEDGKLLNRPKYGDPEVSGYIEITVTKGDARVQSRIVITLKPLNAEEIINNNDIINDSILWNYIRNGNDSQSKVQYSLSYIDHIDAEQSSVPIAIEYAVTDATLAYTRPYDKPRIDSKTGELIRPSYKEACNMVNIFASTNINVSIINGAENGAVGRCIRIGGLKLVATIKLGEAVRFITYNISTLSKYITCDEMLEAVSSHLCIFRQDYTKIAYLDDADNSFEQIIAPASGGSTKLRTYYGQVSETFTYPELLLNKNDILNVNISSKIVNYECTGDYPSADIMAHGFDGGFKEESENADGSNPYYAGVTISFQKFHQSATNDLKKFGVQTTIRVSTYSSNGITPQGGQLTQTRKARFQISTAAMA